MKPTVLALIGKPLAGKDTQADLLVAAYPEAVKISTGHILRAVAEEGETHRFWPIVGHLIPIMEAGIKLPDGPVLEMLGNALIEQVAEGKTLFVFAGSPRSFEQLEGFEQMAKALDARFLVMHLDATDEETYVDRFAFTVGADGVQLSFAPLPAGDYQLGFIAEDYSENEQSSEFVTMNVP